MCKSCDVDKYLAMINTILRDDDYSDSHDFLMGIGEWIIKSKHITPKQKIAIEKISGIDNVDSDDIIAHLSQRLTLLRKENNELRDENKKIKNKICNRISIDELITTLNRSTNYCEEFEYSDDDGIFYTILVGYKYENKKVQF